MSARKESNNLEANQTKQSSWVERISWGAGGFNDMLMNSIPALAMPIYAIALGVNPGLVGLAIALPRVTDALTDPVMGHISDNTRTRWGRRRPYIFVGAILMLLLYPLLWIAPQGLSENGLFLYFTIGLIVFYIANTIWNIPFQALGMELSDDYHERTTVQAVRGWFSNLMALGHGWLYPLCFVFNANEVIGVRYVGLIIGIALCLFGLPSALFCRERKTLSVRAEKVPLFKSMSSVLQNRPFLLLCLALTVGVCGSLLVSPMMMYTNIYYVFKGNKVAAGALVATAGTIGNIASMLCIPLGNKIAKRVGKRRAAMGVLVLLAIGKSSFWLTQNPAYPYLQVLSQIIVIPSMTILWMLIASMLADVCDLDELLTGRRREAIFGAVYQWVWKLGSSLAIVIGGVLLSWIGAKGKAGLNVLPDEVVFRMRIIFYTLPAFFILIGLVFMYYYPLTHKKVESIKRQLHERKCNSSVRVD